MKEYRDIFLLALGHTLKVFFASMVLATMAAIPLVFLSKGTLNSNEIIVLIAVPMLISYLMVRIGLVEIVRYGRTHQQPVIEHGPKLETKNMALAIAVLCIAFGLFSMLVMIFSVGGYYALGLKWAVRPGLVGIGICALMWSLPMGSLLLVKYIRNGGLIERTAQFFSLMGESFPVLFRMGLQKSDLVRETLRVGGRRLGC